MQFQRRWPILFDLAFLEFDMLAHDGVILVHDQLFGLGAGILLGDIEEAGIRGRVHADLDLCWLSHGSILRGPDAEALGQKI